MGLVRTFTLGSIRCHALETGTMRLDGGAVFGIVPRPVWSKRIEPDARNRIPVAMRALLVEHPDGLVLIETGLGNKEDARFHELYGVDNAGPGGRSRLEEALAAAGHRPEDVRWVVNTHLHFDHAGGNTWVERDETGVALGGERLTFPNATYLVQWGELEFARDLDERTRNAYRPSGYEPVAEAGRWKPLRGDVEILPGLSARVTPGHVPHHQSLVLRSGGETLVYLGDVMPTRHHLALQWIAAFDLEPLRTLDSKKKLFRAAQDDGWWFFFGHDAEIVMGRLGQGADGPGLGDVMRVASAGFEGL
ncbi:MAG: MBL fold metallo-hydrolase [Gemmatimonadales bacterium]|nr:MBL fold metallo-hydrolase [Gemmatimonadales bacterium]